VSAPNDGGPAFPVTFDHGECKSESPDMSLRDWFAGQALAGMCASDYWSENAQADKRIYTDPLANGAYAVADAMLKARER